MTMMSPAHRTPNKKPLSKVRCSDQKSKARDQVIKSIASRPQYISQTAKKVQKELYDQRYAIGNFARNMIRKKEALMH